MAEFSWAYIDSEAVLSSSGPTGSIQYRVADSGGNTSVSGSQNFVFHTASNLLAITGSVEISGTLTANQYNINVIDKTVTNISASGDTIFGDTADDTHQFTGSMFINGPLSASSHISASAYYGDGSTLSNITATSISGAMGQFNTVTGLLITSGTMRLGDGGSDVAIIASQLTASQGALFNEQVMIVDDKNLVFGTGGDSVIKYDEASTDRLIVSGSSTGLFLGGGAVVVNSPNVTIQNDSSVIITGSLEITGSDDHLLVLHARDADVTRELVFRKDGVDAGSLYINSSEHIFLRSEVASKDIIFRTNSQNPLRIFGANHSVGIGGAANANGTLDVTGTSIVSGSLIVTGSVLNTTTTIDGTHVSSSLNISGSAFYGSGANLTNVAASNLVTSMTYHNYNTTNTGRQFMSWIHESEGGTAGDYQHVAIQPFSGRLLKVIVSRSGLGTPKNVTMGFYTGSAPFGGAGTVTAGYYDEPPIGQATGSTGIRIPLALDVRDPAGTEYTTGSFSFNSGSTVAFALTFPDGAPVDVFVTCVWEHNTNNMF